MYLLMHCYHIFLLSFVPGTLAEFVVTVKPDTPKFGENAMMEVAYTLGTEVTILSISWFKSDAGGEELGNTIISNIGGNTDPNGRYSLSSNGDLMIASVTVNDTGYYLCHVVATTVGDGIGYNMLTVYYLRTPDLEPKERTFVNENETATFSCPLPDGVPTPSTITWIKDGGVLDVSDAEKYPQSDTTLVISRVNEMDEGGYQCRAESTAYSWDEGKLSNTGKLSLLIPTVSTTTDVPTTTLTTKATSTTSSQQPVTHETTVTSKFSGGGGEPGSSIAAIIGGVIGCLVLVALIVGFSYKYDKLCFSRNAKKASGGGSEKLNLKSNFSDIADIDTTTYAQVQKPKQVKATESKHSKQAVTQTKPPDKPQRAPSRDRANVEQLTYADLDLVKSEGKVIHTDPETTYSSVQNEKQLTYADLDLTKDVNIGGKDKIIRTQPETEYSSVMITRK